MDWIIDLIVERPAMAARYIMWIVCVISGVIGFIATHNNKANKEKVFKNTKKQASFTLENQHGKIEDIDEVDIRRYLMEMFDKPDQFVILTSPQKQRNVRFIQACVIDEGIDVQIAIEKNGTRLYHKCCTKGECLAIFHDFFNNEFTAQMDEYQPVQF